MKILPILDYGDRIYRSASKNLLNKQHVIYQSVLLLVSLSTLIIAICTQLLTGHHSIPAGCCIGTRSLTKPSLTKPPFPTTQHFQCWFALGISLLNVIYIFCEYGHHGFNCFMCFFPLCVLICIRIERKYKLKNNLFIPQWVKFKLVE